MKKIKPITPEEAVGEHGASIDPLIIKVVNKFLSDGFSRLNGEVSIKQEEIVTAYKAAGGKLSGEQLFEKKQLDFEDLYREAGWKVSYNSPDRGESFKEYFKFAKK